MRQEQFLSKRPWLKRLTLELISIYMESCIPHVFEVSIKELGTTCSSCRGRGQLPSVSEGVIIHCPSPALSLSALSLQRMTAGSASV